MKKLKKTNKRLLLISAYFLALAAIALVIVLLIDNTGDVAVLSPKGKIAADEHNLLIFGVALSLIVVLPVYLMTFLIARKYRASNHKAKYRPDWDHSRLFESIWWGVPLVLIIILSIVTWKSSHDLDPYKPLAAPDEQMTVQVVAMNWKWLFIYPEENIATVNYLQLPVDKPVEFHITGDSAMNSFWIPKLGGQIYAMSGMDTRLHLEASETGVYRGSSANISGRGFSGMDFEVKVTSAGDYERWLSQVRSSPIALTEEEYARLSQPTTNNPPAFYASVESGLYAKVIRKYILP